MTEAIQSVIRRLKKSAFSAGAMHRLFICVGPREVLNEFLKRMGHDDFDLIVAPFEGDQLLPQVLLNHQGAHFNRKLFLCTGMDDYYEKIGDDLFRRLEISRSKFSRTATWSLIWIESFELAEKIRLFASGLWKSADITAVFLDGAVLDAVEVDPPMAKVQLISSLGNFPLPTNIAEMEPDTLMGGSPDPSLRFWRDLMGLATSELLLTFCRLGEKSGVVSAEMLFVVGRVAEELRLTSLAQKAKLLSREFESHDLPPFSGEVMLTKADHLFSEGKCAEALELLNNGIDPFLASGVYLPVDRAIRLRALILRAIGRISEAAADLDLWGALAEKSGLPALMAAALEAKAHHAEDLGDAAQAEQHRKAAAEVRVGRF